MYQQEKWLVHCLDEEGKNEEIPKDDSQVSGLGKERGSDIIPPDGGK